MRGQQEKASNLLVKVQTSSDEVSDKSVKSTYEG